MKKNISDIVDRIKEFKKLGKDTADATIAKLLGMTKTALYNHKLRGTIPYKALFTFCEKEGISLDWLLTGEGEMRREKSKEQKPWAIAEGIPIYSANLGLAFLPTDIQMARLIEELVGILKEKGIINETDLPSIVWDRLKRRQAMRRGDHGNDR